MEKVKFRHIGMTVSNLEKISDFYCKYFGFTKGFGRVFEDDFISAVPELYRQPAGTFAKMQMIESQDGVVLELFEFSNTEKSELAEWHMTGISHLAFLVEDIPSLYETMKNEGIEFFMEPRVRGDDTGDGHWIFFKDPDGNIVELWD